MGTRGRILAARITQRIRHSITDSMISSMSSMIKMPRNLDSEKIKDPKNSKWISQHLHQGIAITLVPISVALETQLKLSTLESS